MRSGLTRGTATTITTTARNTTSTTQPKILLKKQAIPVRRVSAGRLSLLRSMLLTLNRVLLGTPLRARFTHGAAWNVFGTAAAQILTLVHSLILAHLLGRLAYG